jgi:predicted O-methyltransferase YrrM
MKLRSIVKVMLLPHRALQERARLIDRANATDGKLVDAQNHIKELTEVRVSLQDELAEVRDERDRFRDILAALDTAHFVTPGHFYSPMPSRGDVEEQLARQVQQNLLLNLPAIDMNIPEQLKLLDSLRTYYLQVPFQDKPVPGLLYQFANAYFSYTDGIVLFCMLNALRPRRIIEIGSGFSTCAILDTNRLCLGGQAEITCIEPHPEILRKLLANSRDAVTIVESKLQDIDLGIFDELGPSDVLFIDSSHVSKVGSDVNYIVFEILPRIKPGVAIQIHDIYIGFEYPDKWLCEGRGWSEAYLLRSFLEYNQSFRILLFIGYLQVMHEAWFREHMPDTLLCKGGSFWMEKL